MRQYVATFFTHFDAICFAKRLREAGFSAKPMPVPRRLSSSCGTCVQFELPESASLNDYREDTIEQIAQARDGGYEILWDNRM